MSDSQGSDKDRTPVPGEEFLGETHLLPKKQQTPSSTAMSGATGLFGRKYKLLSKLGEGGMGAVYLAEDVKLGRKVAIKVLLSEVSGSEQFKGRFMREARSQAKFNHQNIVTLYDSDLTTEGQPYMVMEHVDGKPLDEIIREEDALSLERTLHLFSQLCDGVQTAHKHGIVHRDLKPSNILVTRDVSGKEVVKILDLGLAKLMETAAGAETLSGKTVGATQAGLVLGTPQYMSPEQATGGRIDARTDIYALGMLLCEMITGKLPYQAESAMQWIAKHIAEEPTEPTRIRPDLKLPKGIDAVFNKAVAKDKEERFESALDMLEAFKQAIADVVDVKASLTVRRSSTSLVAMAVLSVALLTGVGVGGYFIYRWKVAKQRDKFFRKNIAEGDNIVHSLFNLDTLELNTALLKSMAAEYEEARGFLGDNPRRQVKIFDVPSGQEIKANPEQCSISEKRRLAVYNDHIKMLNDLGLIAAELKAGPGPDIVSRLKAARDGNEPLKNSENAGKFLKRLTTEVAVREKSTKEELVKEYLHAENAFFQNVLKMLKSPDDGFGVSLKTFNETTGANVDRLLTNCPSDKQPHVERIVKLRNAFREILRLEESCRWSSLLASLEKFKDDNPYLLDDEHPARQNEFLNALGEKITAVKTALSRHRSKFRDSVKTAALAAGAGVSLPQDSTQSLIYIFKKGADDSRWPVREIVAGETVAPFIEELGQFDNLLRELHPEKAKEVYEMLRPDGPLLAGLPSETGEDKELIKLVRLCLTDYYFNAWLQAADTKLAGAKGKLDINKAFAELEVKEAASLYDVVLKNPDSPKAARDKAVFGKWRCNIIIAGDIETDNLLEEFGRRRDAAVELYARIVSAPAPKQEEWTNLRNAWKKVGAISGKLKTKKLPDFLNRSELDDADRYLSVIDLLEKFDTEFKSCLAAHNQAAVKPEQYSAVLFRWQELIGKKEKIARKVAENKLTDARWESYAIREVENKRDEVVAALKKFFGILCGEGAGYETKGEWGEAKEKYRAAQALFSDPRFQTLNITGVIPPEYGALAGKISACENREIEKFGGKRMEEAIRQIRSDMSQGAYKRAQTEMESLRGTIEKIRRLNPSRLPPSAAEADTLAKYADLGLAVERHKASGLNAMDKEDWVEALAAFETAASILAKIPGAYKSVEEETVIQGKINLVRKNIIALYEEQYKAGEQARERRNFAAASEAFSKAAALVNKLPAGRRPESAAVLPKKLDRANNYAHPPVLKINDVVSIPFVYVESPGGGFFISKYEITNSQYEALVEGHERPVFQKKGDSNPVVSLTIYAARLYAKKLQETAGDQIPDGWEIRLPDEQEWKDAASYVPRHERVINKETEKTEVVPETRRIYPWDETLDIDVELKLGDHYVTNSSCYANSNGRDRKVMSRDGYWKTSPVDAFPEDCSFFGVMDMAGNVAEWVETEKDRNKKFRVRGGSWKHPAISAKVDPDPREERKFIISVYPDDEKEWLGFRLVIAPEIAAGDD